MRRFLIGSLLLTVPLACLPLQAWNATGHRIVAAIAYDHLTPQAKARVDELLKQHPDFSTLSQRDAFLAASVWPDTIKGDNRFFDDTVVNPQPTPLLPGFPSMARHTDWHYIDLPFSPDGTRLERPKRPNALIELRRILKAPSLAVYDLPWLIHLTGDVHQPLHCASRFTKSQPHGDQGGNLVIITPGRNLHSFWDGLAGYDTGDAYVDRMASGVTAEFTTMNGAHPVVSMDPKLWINEGFELAKQEVYTFGAAAGTRDNPIALPESYEYRARQVARVQLSKAGFRLAAVLNARLGR
jgi:hypothetical protein